jgi:hypothetical protein
VAAVNPHLQLLLSPVYAGELAPEQRADLAASGLTADTIRAHRFMSVPPSMIRPLLGWDSPRIRSAMLLPYPDPLTGGWLDHVVLRLYPPLRTPRGTIKYAQPRGRPPRLYVPRPAQAAVLGDVTARVLVCEGQKKAACAAQHGFAAVGIQGIEGWHRRGATDLLPDFDLIPLTNRAVLVVPDGDVQSNANVARGTERLAEALHRRGARVRVALLPPTRVEGVA